MKCENGFMLRVPYNSFDFYKNNLEDKDHVNVNCFKENLLVSSPALYETILSKDKLNKDEEESLMKYMIRSATRCTPYGLTSGVLLGEFSEINDLKITRSFAKRVRPDMSWMVKVIKSIEKELGKELKVATNNMHEINGKKITKRWNSCYISNSNLQEQAIHINNTNAVKFVFEICQDYISIENIIKELRSNSSNVSEKAIIDFVSNLLNNEFLTSDLRTGSLITDPLTYVLKKLEEYNLKSDIVIQLRILKDMLTNYEKLTIGEGEAYYQQITQYMSNICENDNYLQVDMFNNSYLYLSEKEKNEIEEFAYFLSRYRYNESYNEYAMKFKEKYGNQAVKYLDLINEETGIGIPKSDDKNSLKYNDQILCRLLSILSENKNDCIQLEEYLKDDVDRSNQELSQTDGELAFYLYNKGKELHYLISPLMGSNTNHRISGRFGYLFENDNYSFIQKGIKEVEVCFLPQSSRHSNVMMCRSNKNAYLEYGSYSNIDDKERINIDDIYVVVDNNNIIRFVQKSTNEVLEFYASNMFNINAYPKELKFLLEITNKQKLIFTSFYTTLQHYVMQIHSYLPRICYKKVTLFPASYSIDKKIDYKNKEKALMSIRDYIKEMQNKYNFSNLVSVGPLDQRMLLNVDNKVHLNILYNMLKNDQNLRIYENLFEDSNLPILDSQNNGYVGELIVNVQSNDKVSNNKLILPDNIQYLDKDKYLQHSKMPFENWISIKLYANDELHNTILINYISKINNELKTKFTNASMFFIRYKDPKSHIRIRIKYQEEELNRIIELVSTMIQKLKKNKIINECVIDTYFQEFERYGGDSIYSGAENIFSSDSDLATSFLKLKEYKQTQLKMTDLFIISVYKLLNDINLSSDDKLYYLDNYNIGKKYNKEFKEIALRLNGYLNNDNMWQNLRTTEEGIKLLITLDIFINDFTEFWKRVEKYYSNNMERKKGILLSLIHMQFNRMIGINRSLENRTMGYIRKLIYNQIMKEKYYGK